MPAGNDPELTKDDQLAQYQNAASELRLIVPEIPYTPPPQRMIAKWPDLGTWYDGFYHGMQRWRDELNKELSP